MKKRNPAVFIFCLYALVLGITMWFHEMWRDELQAWNIAISSARLTDLFHNIRYEGHPSLWFIILWFSSKISVAPETMQVINFLLSLTTAWLIVFRSPFTLFQKTLLVFSYYFLYEYAAISRNYMIGIMMVMLICSLWKNAGKNNIVLLLLLFLICQTNTYGYIFSFSFAFALFVKELRNGRKEWLRASLFPFAAIAGFAVAYLTSAPPPDSEFYLPVHFTFDEYRFLQTFTNCWNAFVPIPRFQLPFWSESLIKPSITSCLLGIALIGLIVFLSVRRSKLAFSFLIPAFLGMLAFMYFKYPGFQRHFGHLFIAYTAFLWIVNEDRIDEVTRNTPFRFSFFNIILVIQLLIGLGFTVADWLLPFSNGKKTAAFIKANYPATKPVAGFTECPAVTVTGYLERNIYFLNNLRYASFVIYQAKRLQVEDTDIYRNIFHLADSQKEIVVALNFNLKLNDQQFLPAEGKDTLIEVTTNNRPIRFLIRNEAHFDGAMVGGENFTVYEVKEEE